MTVTKSETVVGIPLHGSVEHIVRGTVNDRRSHGRALCGVKGSNGWWRNGFWIIDKPLTKAQCKKCLKLLDKEDAKP